MVRESDSFIRPNPDKPDRLYFSDAKDDPIFFFRYPVFRPDSVDVTLTVMKRGELRAAVQEHVKGGQADERRYQFVGQGRCTPVPASVQQGETR